MHDVDSWRKTQRVIATAEVMGDDTNHHFLVSPIDDESHVIYDDVYTQRGDSENDIKELKRGYHADRLSYHELQDNFFHLVLSAVADQLMHYFKSILVNTAFETATIHTIRRHLFKVDVRVYHSVRKLWFLFTSSFVYQNLFIALHQNIRAIQ